MAKNAQRIRIEAAASIILAGGLSWPESHTINASDTGWTFAMPSGAEPNNWLRVEGAHLSLWELEQACLLAETGHIDDNDHLTWVDPRKTGRPPVYDEPLQPVALELPPALIGVLDGVRGATTRREWIETAIRQRLTREDVERATDGDGDDAQ